MEKAITMAINISCQNEKLQKKPFEDDISKVNY